MLRIIRNGNVQKTLAASVNNGLKALSIRHGSFKVQDDKDFLEKVENSKEPVIVDFFAK